MSAYTPTGRRYSLRLLARELGVTMDRCQELGLWAAACDDDDEHFKCVACEKDCIADEFSNTCRECDAPCACAECAGTVGGCHYCAAHFDHDEDDENSVLSFCCDRCDGQMLREGRAQDTLMGYCESGRADCPCVHPDPTRDFNLCGRCAEYNDEEGVVYCNDCLYPPILCFNCDEHFTGDQTSDDFLNWEYCMGRKQWACEQSCRFTWNEPCDDDSCEYCANCESTSDGE